MIVPVYQSEISPAEHRGQLACVEFTGNVLGYATSVWLDYFSSFLQSDMSWRFPLSIQCAIGALLAFGSVWIPESPRWLLDIGQDEQGMQVLADLHGEGDPADPKAREEFREIKEGVIADQLVGDRSYRAMWARYKGRVLIAMSAQMFAQLNGINVIGCEWLYTAILWLGYGVSKLIPFRAAGATRLADYAPLLFESAGWIGRDAILMTGINGAVCEWRRPCARCKPVD